MAHTPFTTFALLLDMDGTLVDSGGVVERVWRRFADEFELDVRQILAESHGCQMRDTVSRFGPAGIDVEAVCAELSAFELSCSDGAAEVPGASAFVAALPPGSVALVTSAPRALAELRMSGAGIRMPRVVVAAEDVPRGKPAPDCYLEAALRLGVDPADATVFEDAEAGIAGARAAGMVAVVVGGFVGATTRGLPRITDFSTVRTTLREQADGRTSITLEL